MAKTNFFVQVITEIIQRWGLDLNIAISRPRNIQSLSSPGTVLGILTVMMAMLLWNWQLLLALVMGVVVMFLVHSMYKWNWQVYLTQLGNFFRSPHSRLILAVGSGGIATLSAYTAAAISVDAHSAWIAIGAIIQGLATLLTLVLLVWHILTFNRQRQEDDLEQLLVNLTNEDALKRLIAVRQLNQVIHEHHTDAKVRQDVIQCLQVLLNQESDLAIRDAVLESLQGLAQLPVLDDNISAPLKLLQITLYSENT